MTAKELAIELNGRDTGEEMEWGEAQDAKDAGLVVVYGYSDDNVEFSGAITDEVGAYNGTTVYLTPDGVLQEPDSGGETFTNKLLRGLKEGGFTGEIYLWSCDRLGTKDPSDLYIKHGKEAAAQLIRGALKGAERIDLEAERTPEAIEGAPIHLRQPEGWIYSEKGISAIDPKTCAPVPVCRTPIILTQRLKSLETGDEKIEVAFKRDGQWQTAIYPRSTIFSSRSITTLADLGCTVTSENAKRVVSFLGALEAENIDLIPKNDATSTFGWQPGKRFLPGHDDGLTLDIDPSQRGMAAAYCKNGTMERWIEHMAPHRARMKFRFILAAEVVDGADWFFRKFMEKLAFPTHPEDTAGNEWLAQRLAILEEDEKRPGGLVEQYRAALLERLDMAEYQKLVCQAYERRVQRAYAPYWARHCRRLDSGWIYNDILQKFWLPSESGRSGGWINSDYSGWDAKFPPHLKEDLP